MTCVVCDDTGTLPDGGRCSCPFGEGCGSCQGEGQCGACDGAGCSWCKGDGTCHARVLCAGEPPCPWGQKAREERA